MPRETQDAMCITNTTLVRRGLNHRCPNCGERTLFPPQSLRVRTRCPSCAVEFARGEGFFLGPWVLNYGVVAFLFVLPTIVAATAGILSWPVALALSVFGSTIVPILLYRSTWSWWLMLYFMLFPKALPANGGRVGAIEED